MAPEVWQVIQSLSAAGTFLLAGIGVPLAVAQLRHSRKERKTGACMGDTGFEPVTSTV